jgi:FkbM family methyltransferase
MTRLRRMLIALCQFLLARRCLLPLNRLLYRVALHGMGLLNYQNPRVSGERLFISRLLPALPADAVILDVGAHVGRYARQIKELKPTATVIAFEPNPTPFAVLQQEAGRSGFRAVNMGCAERAGRVPIYVEHNNSATEHATLYPGAMETIHRIASASYEVEVTALDAFARDNGLQHVHFLKMDVEGHELAVLRGARGLIAAKAVDVIQFEFNDSNVFSHTFLRDFISFLQGYRFFRLVQDGLLPLEPYDPKYCEIFAFQNIVAIREDAAIRRALAPLMA